ncbi:MAG TPA: PilZ domain-containing protein [Gemmatimonadales bacterium]|nr:PilZ domain-containing protein [Gemmatimonadales bacterium]
MAEHPPQRREFTRVGVHLPTDILVDGVIRGRGLIENLSLKGGFLRLAGAPEEGQACEVRVHLDGTEITVRAAGRIVRTGPAGCAIEFAEILGVDSLEHLRNLILFNSHDPSRVEREFTDHLGLRRGC